MCSDRKNGLNKSVFTLTNTKKYTFLFKLIRPTLKQFYGIWETQVGNAVSKCISVRIPPVFAQIGVYLIPNSANSSPKNPSRPSLTKTKFKKTDPILFYYGIGA